MPVGAIACPKAKACDRSRSRVAADPPAKTAKLLSPPEVRQRLIDTVPEKFRRREQWKYQFDPQGVTNEELATLFQQGIDTGKKRNFRIYIGPGADGSSDDKVAVDMKFDATDIAVRYKDDWKGYHKTVFTKHGDTWACAQDNAEMDDKHAFEITPDWCVIFMVPPKGDEFTAFRTINANYDEFQLMMPELNGYKPDPLDAKAVAMNKRQKQTVSEGLGIVDNQDKAM